MSKALEILKPWHLNTASAEFSVNMALLVSRAHGIPVYLYRIANNPDKSAFQVSIHDEPQLKNISHSATISRWGIVDVSAKPGTKTYEFTKWARKQYERDSRNINWDQEEQSAESLG